MFVFQRNHSCSVWETLTDWNNTFQTSRRSNFSSLEKHPLRIHCFTFSRSGWQYLETHSQLLSSTLQTLTFDDIRVLIIRFCLVRNTSSNFIWKKQLHQTSQTLYGLIFLSTFFLRYLNFDTFSFSKYRTIKMRSHLQTQDKNYLQHLLLLLLKRKLIPSSLMLSVT